MPTYEYVCGACEHTFDEFQGINDKPLKKCPACGKSKLQRLFGTGSAVLFKGSGFYETDYRSDSYKASAKSDAESSKPAAGTNETSGKADANGTTAVPKKADGTGGGKSPKSAK